MLALFYTFLLGFSAIIGMSLTVASGDRISKAIAGGTFTATVLLFISFRYAKASEMLASLQREIYQSVMVDHTYLVVIGAVCGVLWTLHQEEQLIALWRRVSPQTAPTYEARIGQRAMPAVRTGFGKASGAPKATLMGTSTDFLKDNELDMRTETLVKLCFYAFSGNPRATIPVLQASLNCGYGQREKNFQRLVGSLRGRPNLKQTVHRYWRSINGNAMAARQFYYELCTLAKKSGNTDKTSVDRLAKVGSALGLSPEDMGLAISRMR